MSVSDPYEEVYTKYMTDPLQESEDTLSCPHCLSELVDRRAGYRGEYKCKNCGYFWRR
ncbi:MAG: hypothetical protein OK422_01540 [Thaumarchaeota archaeon]|nr:hypothetical protein [Nitrososphaerota archaeon]